MIQSTSKFEVVEVLYDRGGFALARGYWDGDRAIHRHACRWHEDGGIGYPQSYGKPQWLLLPDEAIYERLEVIEPNGPGLQTRVTVTLKSS